MIAFRSLLWAVFAPMIVLTTGAVLRRLQAQDWRVRPSTQAAMLQIGSVALLVALVGRLARPVMGAALGAAVAAVGGIGSVWIIRAVIRYSRPWLPLTAETRLSLAWFGVVLLAVLLAAMPGMAYLLGMRGPIAVFGVFMMVHNRRADRLTSTQPSGSAPGD